MPLARGSASGADGRRGADAARAPILPARSIARRGSFIRRIVRCAVLAVTASACSTAAEPERAARAAVVALSRQYRPGEARIALPRLSAESALADYLRFAMLSSPRIEAAYYAWVAEVEAITPARSRPDPTLTLESDVSDTVMSLLSGLMLELPGPGKLRVAADVQAATSRGAYFTFESELLRTALQVKTAYYRAGFLEESIRVQRETLGLLRDLERLAQIQNSAGRATLQDVLRLQIAREQVGNQIANLEDSRSAVGAELKAALGLGPAAAAPPLPARFEPSAGDTLPEDVLTLALARNPGLRAMEEDVRRAEAELALAQRARIPDLVFGLEFDLKAAPTLFTPQTQIRLPIWREKLLAQIAAAQASKQAAQSRLSAEQVEIAAELVSMLYTYREGTRNHGLLRDRLIPMARRSLEAARAGYVNGRSQFLDVIEAQRSLLEFELALIDAAAQRELALAGLSLTIAGVPPTGAPTLPPEAASPREPSTAPGVRP
jgi:cobalt-zinc-cadmium efflux system outer membrane protein